MKTHKSWRRLTLVVNLTTTAFEPLSARPVSIRCRTAVQRPVSWHVTERDVQFTIRLWSTPLLSEVSHHRSAAHYYYRIITWSQRSWLQGFRYYVSIFQFTRNFRIFIFQTRIDLRDGVFSVARQNFVYPNILPRSTVWEQNLWPWPNFQGQIRKLGEKFVGRVQHNWLNAAPWKFAWILYKHG